MVNLLPIRLSVIMSAEQLAQFIAGAKMMREALPLKPAMSKKEYDKLPKKGPVRDLETPQILKVVRRYPKFLPPSVTLQDVENDAILYDQLSLLDKEHLKEIVELVEMLIGLSGSEELNAYSRFELNVKVAAADQDPDAIEAQNMLDAIDRNRPGSSGKAKPTPPAV